MIPRATLALGLLLAAPVAAPAQGSAALDAVAEAMGGKDHILAVRTLLLEGNGDAFNLGQNLTPSADLPRYEVTHYSRRIDIPNRRWFVDLAREPKFLTGNTATQRLRQGLDGDVAYNVGNDGVARRAPGTAAEDRATELFHHPIVFLQAAWSPGSEVTEESPRGQLRSIHLNALGNQFTILVDPVTSLPARIQSPGHHPMLGDVTVETEFSDWRRVDGLMLPMRLTQRIAGKWILSDIRLTSARVNADVGDLDAGAEARAQPASGAAPVTVNVEEIAAGVWLLDGQTHHSVAIEQQHSIVLVEAPQNDERTLAVIEKARSLVPGKPVEMVINTHHHFDHAGGIRAAISQGLVIATHEGNRDFYERTVFPARHVQVPDALARTPMPLRLLALPDKYVRHDSLRTIETYQVIGSAHSATMLMVYLPAERLLIQADLYNPPAPDGSAAPAFPFAANLLENIQRRGLQVERVAGIHGRVVPIGEIQAAARAP